MTWVSVLVLGTTSALAGTAGGWAVARWLSARAAVGLGLALVSGLVALVWVTTYSLDHDGLAWATLGSIVVLPASAACATMGMRKLQRRRARRSRG
ncbi:hypothetical protein [Rhodobaculum claviforme]|uniref:Uncharacterized protein n=1 Tax=Rhodobaculum claviforme TaxID=1549854 RepID=A0A934TLI2_9RHOB|nr:hypothetical protein [Rhodobaculum claviforme]MBK5927342.1 hypothetical protein [Rhodobaculum claviforme]